METTSTGNVEAQGFVKLPPKIQWDCRLGGIPHLVLAWNEELMQIPDEIRKCVAFLACRRNSGYVTKATAFFVEYPIHNSPAIAYYAVTARHVIDEIVKRGDTNIYCRVNTRQHRTEYVTIPFSKWVFNDDSQIDVAVALWDHDFSKFDHRTIPVSMFIDASTIEREELSIGEDVFFPGLFVRHPGVGVNIPVVRVGNIAAMPEETIETAWGSLPRGYLIEARSIGGLSGSPVFCDLGSTRSRSGNITTEPPRFFLLGLVHGHYAESEGAWDLSDDARTDVAETRSINMGIAIAVPADDIRSTLEHPALQKQRELFTQQVPAEQRRNLPSPDQQ